MTYIEMYGERLPKRMYEFQTYKVERRWRTLHNEELRKLYSTCIARVIKITEGEKAGSGKNLWEKL
jgi:hypothetical protein